jgi:hypothetical protein
VSAEPQTLPFPGTNDPSHDELYVVTSTAKVKQKKLFFSFFLSFSQTIAPLQNNNESRKNPPPFSFFLSLYIDAHLE